MWHTTEIVKIFEKITEDYGYEIYQNRKRCAALCSDLLVEYSTEKNIMQMLFQVGLGEAMKGVPFKNERELKIGLCTDPQMLDQKSNDWRSIFLWLNIVLNLKRK